MKYCKDCVGFEECKITGRTVEFAVDDGVCIDFDERKPQTNGDRIRSMSDEELAAFLCKKFGCYSETCPGIELCKPNEGKANGVLKWLQQPAEPPKEE